MNKEATNNSIGTKVVASLVLFSMVTFTSGIALCKKITYKNRQPLILAESTTLEGPKVLKRNGKN